MTTLTIETNKLLYQHAAALASTPRGRRALVLWARDTARTLLPHVHGAYLTRCAQTITLVERWLDERDSPVTLLDLIAAHDATTTTAYTKWISSDDRPWHLREDRHDLVKLDARSAAAVAAIQEVALLAVASVGGIAAAVKAGATRWGDGDDLKHFAVECLATVIAMRGTEIEGQAWADQTLDLWSYLEIHVTLIGTEALTPLAQDSRAQSGYVKGSWHQGSDD